MAKKILVRFICTMTDASGNIRKNIPEEVYIPLTEDIPSDNKKFILLAQGTWAHQNRTNVGFGPKKQRPTVEILEILSKKAVERAF